MNSAWLTSPFIKACFDNRQSDPFERFFWRNHEAVRDILAPRLSETFSSKLPQTEELFLEQHALLRELLWECWRFQRYAVFQEREDFLPPIQRRTKFLKTTDKASAALKLLIRFFEENELDLNVLFTDSGIERKQLLQQFKSVREALETGLAKPRHDFRRAWQANIVYPQPIDGKSFKKPRSAQSYLAFNLCWSLRQWTDPANGKHENLHERLSAKTMRLAGQRIPPDDSIKKTRSFYPEIAKIINRAFPDCELAARDVRNYVKDLEKIGASAFTWEDYTLVKRA